MQSIQEAMQYAAHFFEQGNPPAALQILQQAPAGPPPRGMNHLRSLCLTYFCRFQEALQAVQVEMSLYPDNADARKEMEALEKVCADFEKRRAGQPRDWRTSMPRDMQLLMEAGAQSYTYRDVPMIKDPYDLAMYPMLLWRAKPRTIIEIGSWSGGSALWFGDMFDSYKIDGHIYSLDITQVTNVAHPRVTFMAGNGRDLQPSFFPEFMASLPRPLLVIDDADHAYETSIKIAEFFHQYLRPGEYLVVEDGMSNNGPRKAIVEFLQKYPRDYGIDGRYCDHFGYNTTWFLNGYIVRLQPPSEAPAQINTPAT